MPYLNLICAKNRIFLQSFLDCNVAVVEIDAGKMR